MHFEIYAIEGIDRPISRTLRDVRQARRQPTIKAAFVPAVLEETMRHGQLAPNVMMAPRCIRSMFCACCSICCSTVATSAASKRAVPRHADAAIAFQRTPHDAGLGYFGVAWRGAAGPTLGG
jgi:hypothetical protein